MTDFQNDLERTLALLQRFLTRLANGYITLDEFERFLNRTNPFPEESSSSPHREAPAGSEETLVPGRIPSEEQGYTEVETVQMSVGERSSVVLLKEAEERDKEDEINLVSRTRGMIESGVFSTIDTEREVRLGIFSVLQGNPAGPLSDKILEGSDFCLCPPDVAFEIWLRYGELDLSPSFLSNEGLWIPVEWHEKDTDEEPDGHVFFRIIEGTRHGRWIHLEKKVSPILRPYHLAICLCD